MVHVEGRSAQLGGIMLHTGFAAHDGAHDFDVFDLVRINVLRRISEITKSASLPVVMLPLMPSSNEA